MDPLYLAYHDRQNAAEIISFCKISNECNPDHGGVWSQRGCATQHEHHALERAALMLERRGYGATFRNSGGLCFRLN